MEEATTTTGTTGVGNNPTPMQHQQQQQLLQQQLFLLHQYQQQPNVLSLQHQQAMSRFSSNIDAHLRPLRSLHTIQHQTQQINSNNPPAAAAAMPQLQLQQAAAAAAAGLVAGRQQQKAGVGLNPVEAEMVHQDLMKVCNPDVKRPFASIEDAVLRLLPYHVVSDYEAEEDDRALDNDPTGQAPSRLQQWDHNILSKIAEFTTNFEKQVHVFNAMSKKRAEGEFRSEERLMIEQALLHEEKQALLEIKANREAKMRVAMAQAEQARAHTMAAVGSHGGVRWGNSGRIENGNSSSGNSGGFLNDENESEDGEELDLNGR